MNAAPPIKKLFKVRHMEFATRKEADSYAKTASRMFDSFFTVKYDGFAVATFKHGKAVKE